MSENSHVTISATRGPISAKRAIRQGTSAEPTRRRARPPDAAARCCGRSRRRPAARRRARPGPPAPRPPPPRPRPRRRPRARARGSGSPSAISGSETCDDRGDVVAHDRQCDRAGLEVAGEAVRERLPHVDRHDPARRQRRGERRRALRLDRDDPRAGRAARPTARGRSRGCRRPAARRRSAASELRLELAPEGRLARDHAGVVVGGDVAAPSARARARAPRPRRSPPRAARARPASPQRRDLGGRGRLGHDDRRADAERRRRPGDAEARVARRRGHDRAAGRRAPAPPARRGP